jgi:hypothetical protein
MKSNSVQFFLDTRYIKLTSYQVLKTLSDIVSDRPMFWSDMIGHLIILKRDVVSCQY